MKKFFTTALLSLFTILLFAQENLASDDIKVPAQIPQAHLRIRKNVIRPEGKAWYLFVSAGWGMPFLTTNKRSPLKEIGDKDWYQHNGDLSVKPLFGTNGGGFALNVGTGHMFNKNIGIEGMFTFAWHPEKLDARIDLDTYYASEKTGTFGMYLSPHLVMKWDNGKRFGMTAKVGPVIPFFGNTTSNAYILDKQGRIIETLGGYPILPLNLPGLFGLEIELTAKAHTSYQPTVGVSASMAFDVKLNDMLTLFAEVRVQAYSIKLKETVFDEFKQTSSINVLGIKIPAPDGLLVIPSNVDKAADAPEFLKHYVYRDEITEESNTARYGFKEIVNLDPNKPEVDINKPMDEPGVKFNASTLYFNAGLRIGFDRWSKKREAKRLQSESQRKSKTSGNGLQDPDSGIQIKTQ